LKSEKLFLWTDYPQESLQLQGHVTQKLGKIAKIQRDQIQILSCSLRISGHLPAATVNGGADSTRKVQFSKLQKPRDLDLDLDLGSGHMAYPRASVIDLYLHTKFH